MKNLYDTCNIPFEDGNETYELPTPFESPKLVNEYIADASEKMLDIFADRNPDVEGHIFTGSGVDTVVTLFQSWLEKSAQRYKTKLIRFERVRSNMSNFWLNPEVVQSNSEKKKTSKFCAACDQTGMFRAVFTDGTDEAEILMLRWVECPEVGRTEQVFSVWATSEVAMNMFYEVKTRSVTKRERPKPGIYNPTVDNAGNIIYGKPITTPTPPVLHQNSNHVFASIEMYFQNRERYLRNGKSGAKRILLYGNAGTGKTTLAYQIANMHKEKYCCIFSTSIGTIATHAALCAKHKVPTIIVAEECDKWMGIAPDDPERERADGNVKAFLDGHLSARNPAGELSILITNYPNRIEKTILLRPGRIHDSIYIGPLDGDNVVAAAAHYFKDEDDKPVCDPKEFDFLRDMKLTGAQIERLADATFDFVNGTDTPINAHTIQKVLDQYRKGIGNVKDYKEEETLLDERSFGFNGSPAGFGRPDKDENDEDDSVEAAVE